MQEHLHNKDGEQCRDRCGTVDELINAVKELRVRNAILEQQANHDDLTETLRRNQFFELSERQFSLARRHQRPLCVLLLDADHFKSINDNYGHAIGDEVLQSIAGICRRNLRTSDIFGRYGGEEFAITLPETGLAEAAIVAERIRRSIEGFSISPTGHGPVNCTVSIGVAAHAPMHNTFAELLEDADARMLEAKRQGRNCIASNSGHGCA